MEGTRADARHTVGDCDARKPGATLEGIGADACHTVGDCDARKPGAILEGIGADACHTVGKSYAFKSCLNTESTVFDYFDRDAPISFWNNHIISVAVISRHRSIISIIS